MARVSGKLTGKSLGWDRASVATAIGKVPAATGRVFIGRIVGTVNGLHNTFDEEKGEVQTGLKGEFRGISSLNEFEPSATEKDAQNNPVLIDTGNPIVVTAGRCYLPSGLQDMIETAYKNIAFSKNDKGETVEDKSASLNFGVDLYAIPATNKAGYSYDGDTVLDAAPNDPLALLLDSANKAKPLPGAKVAALEAPKDEAKAEPKAK